MHFPNMGGKQNIEGRFLGLCFERSLVRNDGCYVVYDLLEKFTNLESCEIERLAWLGSSLSKSTK